MIEVWSAASLADVPGEARALFRMRHRVFCEDLNWVPASPDGLEQDEYDRPSLEPIYLLTKNQSGRLGGCVRLLPTTAPYMLKNTFGHLWQGRTPIQDPCIWEASRFAIWKGHASAMLQMQPRKRAAELLQGMCEFGLSYGVDDYLVVVTPSMNALVTKLGATTEVFGSARDREGQTILAARCEVSLNVLDRLRRSTGVFTVTTNDQKEGLESVYAA